MAKNNNLTHFLTSEASKFRSVLGTLATINPQDFDDLIDSVFTKGYNDWEVKVDCGFVPVTSVSSSVTVTGIKDSNGNSFTPNNVVFMVAPPEGSSTGNTSTTNTKCVAFVATTSEKIMVSTDGSYKMLATNMGNNVTFASGKFTYTNSTEDYKIPIGRYMWIAWKI